MLRLLHCSVLCALVLRAQEPSGFGGLRFRELPKPIECPVGINDLGEIVRGCWIDEYGYRISPDGVETQLAVPGLPAGINNLGQVVINQRTGIILLHPDGRSERRTVDGARSITAHGLNNKGEIAGEADNKPVLWNADGAPRVVTLPVAQGPQSYLIDVNDSGTLLGSYTYTGPFLFRWTTEGFFLSGNRGFDRFRGNIANDGVTLSVNPFPLGIDNDVSGPNFSSLFEFRVPRIAFAMSRNGRLLLGESFLAERCPTEVTPRRAELPLEGGKLRVRVDAEPECEWAVPLYGFSGTGSAEIDLTFDPLEEPAVTHRIVAGKEIEIHQGVGACSFSTPGYSFTAPSTGGTLRIPVTVTDGCSWSAQSDTSWLIVDSTRHFMGSATVSLEVEPNVSAGERRAMLTLGPVQVPVVQAGRTCTYRVLPFGPLPPGQGAVLVPVETQPGCNWTLSSSVPWLLEIPSSGQVNFAANPTNAARSATLTIAGQRFTVTQEAVRAGEPYSVEPFDSSGPRQTFRFKYYEPPGTEPLRFAQIFVGNECTIEYRIALRPYDVRGTCTLEDASSIVEGDFRVLRLTLSLQQRGARSLISYPRQLGVFHSTNLVSAPTPVIRPLEIPANPPAGSSLWIDSRPGVGGTFRFYVDPSLGRLQTLAVEFERCVVTINPTAGTMRVENFIEADGPPKPTNAVPFGDPAALQTRYCMVDPQRSRLALPVLDLAVFFPANDPFPRKTIRLRATGVTGNSRVAELGTYFSINAIPAPRVLYSGNPLKLAFRSDVPIQQAQVEIGACLVNYSRGTSPTTNAQCSGPIEATLIGHDVVLTMSLAFSTQSTPMNIRTRFTPEGFSDTGWFLSYLDYLP